MASQKQKYIKAKSNNSTFNFAKLHSEQNNNNFEYKIFCSTNLNLIEVSGFSVSQSGAQYPHSP
jgi:hypothetical protein